MTLQVMPVRASAGERVDLSGVYPRGEGATLQVQRFEGGWTDFPVTASVSGGTFRTYIYTSGPASADGGSWTWGPASPPTPSVSRSADPRRRGAGSQRRDTPSIPPVIRPLDGVG